MDNMFRVGKDCNCPNSHKYHFIKYNGKRYIMEPKINGGKNKEFVEVRNIYTRESYRIEDMLSELLEKYSTWEES